MSSETARTHARLGTLALQLASRSNTRRGSQRERHLHVSDVSDQEPTSRLVALAAQRLHVGLSSGINSHIISGKTGQSVLSPARLTSEPPAPGAAVVLVGIPPPATNTSSLYNRSRILSTVSWRVSVFWP
eukprot:TRINITY_DN24825_c0_g1_i8.p1 TRINITY_DN24825_c0_g1~~TRINITY_DN24825_c0_g1_i8.p1  ORF type:complete len:130 (+),score=0.97 TRINITY_DN24825_c0_g1_i8:359-748(+)